MTTDRDTFSLVVKFLGFLLLISAGGIVGLTLADKEVPDILGQLAVGSLAGLTGLLARTPTNDKPQDVKVVNPPQEPVPTDPEPEVPVVMSRRGKGGVRGG